MKDNIVDPLFTPLKLGDITLEHRVVLAPLTRYRAPNYVPGKLMVEYYTQRASKGGLMITEATSISPSCGVHPNNPRVDLAESIEGWKDVVNAIHEKGGYIFMQLNHFGRSGIPKYNAGKLPFCSTSKKLSGPVASSYPETNLDYVVPKAMDEADMIQVINEFADAAYNAIEIIGCDGVELHGANGYLLDEFLRDDPNSRTDEYGGSVENRCKFPLRVLDAVIARLGGKSSKVGFRISPWDKFQEMNDSNPTENFRYICSQLELRNLAYVHAIEARSDSNGGRENDAKSIEASDPLLISTVAQLKGSLPNTALISAGGWDSSNSLGIVGVSGLDLLAYGRHFLANPDLPLRLKNGYSLNPYDRDTFYSALDPRGYVDYPFYSGI
ncbi:hypothetical protein CANARDRAFT_29318 [[Candida] arabinofermentans NRRL YB-2248]|uniref:NADH:flavin oxidoreductase/NADH oxidase N-terminal domain-containing protein n=1 Tax=[Candida] arabinofermentans NRRL YB-2248 TaxID=983967 RepID=A0A1E4SXF0_9ASCO|nr:hypothetical protein CANARDRAFT_29318 [[Candida] arabinofermentans NRRL YB-2248]